LTCGTFHSISKRTVVAMTTPSMLDTVDEEIWGITAFNPETRFVCVDLNNGKRIVHLVFTLSVLS
jgi:hypothetical protein